MNCKKIFPVTIEVLNELSTRQLLARLKRLQQCEESSALSNRVPQDYDSAVSIEFKDNPQWNVEYDNVKAVLRQRERLAKGTELVAQRRNKAREGKTFERKNGKRQYR